MARKTSCGITHGVICEVLDCLLDVSEFDLQLCYCVHLFTNTLEKHQPSYIAVLWVEYHHYYSSTKMDLAFNNPRNLICH